METLQITQTTPEKLVDLITKSVSRQLQTFKQELELESSNNDLLSIEETCELLQINKTTLYHWSKAGKVIIYGIGGRRYYKRSEILKSLIALKK